MSLTLAQEAPRRARRELVTTWATAIALLALAALLSRVDPTGLLGGNLAGVAAFLFIALPERRIHRRGEDWGAFGLAWWGAVSARTWRAWGRGLLVALAVCAAVFPFFLLGFWGYARALAWLPHGLAARLAPYAPGVAAPSLRLPDRFALLVAVQLLVVALPEELFYRGWMQTTWAASDPGRKVRVLGADLGRGFLATQALFAAGHLATMPQPWRLATFFPGLLFGWLRARTGGLAAPVFVHALSNLFLAVLEASFYPYAPRLPR